METSDNIRQLLEMLDHPQDYSEQEILDIINQDDETRDAYRQMVDIKRSRHVGIVGQPYDIDKAWQRFEKRHLAPKGRERSWLKLVATFIGIVVLSGIAVAAVYSMRHTADDSSRPKAETSALEHDETTSDVVPAIPVDSVPATEPLVFDNIPLETILREIADYYGMEVQIRDHGANSLRFHFVWDKADGVDKVVEDLNHFESVDIEVQGNRLIVR